jgi:arylsulfatase A-like enzyme
MVGSDTLRADRLGHAGYRRSLTPNLDRLAEQGANLTQCYVPCARTAPSLLSLMTGTWPHTHGVRDNFVTDEQTRLQLPTLPGLLADAGYNTAVLSDWAGSDMGKFDLGFDEQDLPGDQWNIHFFMRQGPKDIRLFLSLFLSNRIGKFFLEEIYYLGGVPLTRQLGLRARQMLEDLASDTQPFFLNVFMASTHPPFASEYPYYTKYADPNYRGPSKFAMAKLTDPFEIIRRQGEPREEFDLEQILDLYDGCVNSFDDELGRILDYLQTSGLAENTLVVVYSDHGMEFFEHETWGQGNSAIGDFSARVPVVMAGPSLKAGGCLDGVTRSVDLAPTLLELLGLTVPPEMEGTSLAAALKGGKLPELPAFYETGIWLTAVPGMPVGHLSYPNLLDMLEIPDPSSGTMAIKPEYQDRIIAAKDRMIRSGRWKLVYQPLVTGLMLRLFDLETDPACQYDVSDAHPKVKAELWLRLQHFLMADQKTA